MFDSEFFITIGFFAFFVILFFFNIHKLILNSLDDNIQKKIGELLESQKIKLESEQDFHNLEAKTKIIGLQIQEIEHSTHQEIIKLNEISQYKISEYNKRALELKETKLKNAERKVLSEIKLNIIGQAYSILEKNFQDTLQNANQDKILLKSLNDLKKSIHS